MEELIRNEQQDDLKYASCKLYYENCLTSGKPCENGLLVCLTPYTWRILEAFLAEALRYLANEIASLVYAHPIPFEFCILDGLPMVESNG